MKGAYNIRNLEYFKIKINNFINENITWKVSKKYWKGDILSYIIKLSKRKERW